MARSEASQRRARAASEIVSGTLMGLGLYALVRTGAVIYRETDKANKRNEALAANYARLRRVNDEFARVVERYPNTVCVNSSCRSGIPAPHVRLARCGRAAR